MPSSSDAVVNGIIVGKGCKEVLGLCCWEEIGDVMFIEELYSTEEGRGLAALTIGGALRRCQGGKGATWVELQVHKKNTKLKGM